MAHSVAVIGSGQFGSVIASHAANLGHRVRLWARTQEEIAPMLASRESSRLPGLKLHASVVPTLDGAHALEGASIVVSAIPSQYARSIWKVLGKHLPNEAILVSVAKGFETDTLLRPSEVLRQVCPSASIIALSGPTIATEVARGLPTALVAAGDMTLAKHVQAALGGDSWRIYCSNDIVGVECAGAIKNVIALAAGMVDGMELGTNAKATLLARGIAEISRLGVALGGQRDTFFGIVGVGDLATTCFSPDGRNRSLGELLGRGQSLEAALASMNSVVEGIDTCKAVMALASRHSVEMPIASAVHGVLFAGTPPQSALRELMRRESVAERI